MDRWQISSLALLYIIVILLATMVVANRHQARQLFGEYQQLEKNRDALNASWSRLVLEQSTQLNQATVENRAQKVLGMQKPIAESIRIIRE